MSDDGKTSADYRRALALIKVAKAGLLLAQACAEVREGLALAEGDAYAEKQLREALRDITSGRVATGKALAGPAVWAVAPDAPPDDLAA